MIILWIRLKLNSASKSQFLDVIRGVLEPTRALEGCIDSRLCEDLESPGSIILVQLWTDSGSLARYLQDRRFVTILKAIDISDESPEFLICESGELQVLSSAHELIERFSTEGK